MERRWGRKRRPLYGKVKLNGTARVVTFKPSLNICTDKIGVATANGSLAFELNVYEFKAGPRLENIAMATEEVGVATGSSTVAERSSNRSESAKIISLSEEPGDSRLVLIRRCSRGDESCHTTSSAVAERYSSVSRNSSALNPASSTTPTQP